VALARLVALLVLLLVAPAWAQTDPERPPFQFIPALAVTTNNALVRFGDLTNHSIRVSVVSGAAAGGTSSNFGATFPGAGTAVGAVDAGGFMASLTVSNTGRLLTTCDNCSSSSFTDNSAFTAGGTSVGIAAGVFNDGLASVTSTNAAAARLTAQRGLHVNLRDEFGNRVGINALPLRIDPTGTTTQPVSGAVTVSGTVTATGTVSAHQADTWTVSCINCSGASSTNYGANFPAAGTPIGFKDGAGRFASATVDNAGFLLVTASQGAANVIPWNIAGTVTATGTITAHQGDTWTVGLSAGTSVNAVQSGTWTVQQGTPPWSVSQSGGWTVTATGTVTAHQGDTWTVGLSTGANTIGAVTGTSADNAANSSLKLPTLPGRANASAPTWTEGNQAPQSMTLTGDQRVRPDYSAATGSIAPARVAAIGGYGASANPSPITVCDNYATISISNSGLTQIITGGATQFVRICSVVLVVSSATGVNIVEGSGSTCGTNKTGLIGGSTALTGLNLATNGGLTMGTGVGEIARMQVAGNNVCINNTTAAVIAGGMTWTKF
jgi:hypothetical protein